MKKTKTMIAFLLVLVLALVVAAGLFTACGDKTDDPGKDDPIEDVTPGGDDPDDPDPDDPDEPVVDKEVDEIEVKTMPVKTEYVVGETLDLTGGVLLVTYEDGSTGEVPMTDPGVTFTAPNMNTPGRKNVTLNYGGARVRVTVNVATAAYTVTFDVNYEGGEDFTSTVTDGSEVAKPADPMRSGYTFYNWYTDADFREVYDFGTEVSGDMTLYAFWKKDGATYVDFTFDYDFYGKKLTKYTIPAEVGAPVAKPADPVRDGYEFDGWYTDDTYATEYDFTANVTAADEAVAKWTKTDTDVSEFTFEAEDTDLTDKSGPSWSGTAEERSMIQFVEGIGASGNRFVGYQYQKDCSLEFYIASDVAVDNAVLKISIASEIGDFTLDSDKYQIKVNGTVVPYTPINLESPGINQKGQFATYTIGNISLKAGENFIQLVTNNSATFQGATYKAYAPMVDCLKIETDAILYWDEVHGLPAANY